MSYELSDETIAQAFLSERARYGFGDAAEELIDEVEEYLARAGLPWRSAAAVAQAVNKLTAQPPVPRPDHRPAPALDPAEDLAFVDDQRQGYGDGRTLPDVTGMSMAEFSRIRGQLGIGGSRDAGIFGRLV